MGRTFCAVLRLLFSQVRVHGCCFTPLQMDKRVAGGRCAVRPPPNSASECERMDSMENSATTNRLLTAIVILMTLAAIYFAKDVVLPVVLGFMLAPDVRRLSRRGLVPGFSRGAVRGTDGNCGLAAGWKGYAAGSMKFPVYRSNCATSFAASPSWWQRFKTPQNRSKTWPRVATTLRKRRSVQQPGLLTTAVSNLASFVTSLAAGLILALFLLSSVTCSMSRSELR